MEIAFVGIGFDATLMLPILERNIPARYLTVSSETIDLEAYQGDKISFRMHPSIEAAALRILPKIKKRTKEAEIVFLLSEVTGKKQEDIICNIAEGLDNKPIINMVWYPKKKHGQRGIFDSLEQLGKHSSVIAIPQIGSTKLPELVSEYVKQILLMYQLPYAYAQADTGKRILSKGGLLHLAQEEIDIEYLTHDAEMLPWSISCIGHNKSLDTLLEYGHCALIHLTVPKGADPAIVQYIIEYIHSHLGEEGELNFSITVTTEPRDSVGIDLLVTDTVTAKEAESWSW